MPFVEVLQMARHPCRRRTMNQLKAGAAISYAALGINILTGLFYTPWMIHSIGRANFGLYTLAMSVISLFVFDFGLSSAVTRYIAKYLAMGRQDLADNCLGLVYKLYVYIDMALFVILAGVYFFIPKIYTELTPAEIDSFKVVYSIAAVYSVLSFPFIPVNGILTAHEKIIQLKLADVIQKLFIVAAMTVCLLAGYGLYALVTVNAAGGLLCIAFKLRCIRRDTRQHVSWKYFSRPELKELASYSGWITVIALAQRCIFNLAPTILGITSGAVPIAILGIAVSIEGYCFTFANAINGIFLPKVTRIVVKGDGDVLPLMIKVGRLQLYVVALIVVGFICFGSQFIRLWVGDGFSQSYLCAVLIILPSFFHLPQMIGTEAIYARNKVRQLAADFIVMALCNVVLAFVLSPALGALGICVSICIAYMLRTIGMDFIFVKDLKINISAFFRKTFAPMLPVLAVLGAGGYAMAYFCRPDNWFSLCACIAVFTAAYVVVVFGLLMDADEKALVLNPIKHYILRR